MSPSAPQPASKPVAAPPTHIEWHKKSNTLELHFPAEGNPSANRYHLTAELLRVYSPSAEVRGHGSGDGELPYGKAEVRIQSVALAGNYALHIVFDDGHDSGIYTWSYLAQMGVEQEPWWANYLLALKAQGKSRYRDEQVVKFLG